jgi:hypothetical protein
MIMQLLVDIEFNPGYIQQWSLKGGHEKMRYRRHWWSARSITIWTEDPKGRGDYTVVLCKLSVSMGSLNRTLLRQALPGVIERLEGKKSWIKKDFEVVGALMADYVEWIA